MRYTIFDVETDGLLETVSLIHCLSYQVFENKVLIEKGTITNYNEITLFILRQEILVGHNIIRYDIPVLEKVLNIEINARLIDTLALSWYLYPKRIKHGLDLWGDELGVVKPTILDWKNLSTEEYTFRCESDVSINELLYHKQLTYLEKLYEGNTLGIIRYLMYKLDCAKEQEGVKCKVDVELTNNTLRELHEMKDVKITILKGAMPRNIKYKAVSKPKKFYKKDETISVAGYKWLAQLEDLGYSLDYEGEILVKKLDEIGNPASSIQIKAWLFDLGWLPAIYESRKDSKGIMKEVPQVYDGEEVCQSIKDLFEIEPALENLNFLSIINHRIGIFQGYLDKMDSNGMIKATIAGFTNTLRFKHSKPLVNLPGVYKPYGQQIRGSLIAPTGEHLLCGSDMSSLEDTTKQHYMYFFDPEYVKQMRVPGFDPHLDIAVLAGMMSIEDAEWFKWSKKQKQLSVEDAARASTLNRVRSHAKTVNFAGVYGAGAAKIAKTLDKPLSFAKTLHKTYWDRNKSVKQVANSVTIRIFYKNGTIRDMPSRSLNSIPRWEQDDFFDSVEQMWLLNPISGFYYSLRYPKDIFSTLNQGSGVYCFDLWVKEVRSSGIKISMQYHDEVMFSFLQHLREEIPIKLNDAIEVVNSKVKLNVPLGISVDIGQNYAEIH